MDLRNFAEVLAAWQARARWRLDASFRPPPDGCEHGGASFAAIGTDIRSLHRRIGSSRPMCWTHGSRRPGVRAALTEDPAWPPRTSPPTGAQGLIADAATGRLPADTLAVGAGSSDLIFRAFGTG